MTEHFRTTETAALKTKRQTRVRRRPEPVEIQRVDRRVLDRAKQLADGDTTRFKFVPARFGIAVVVLNQKATS